jgi:hypothetical protein
MNLRAVFASLLGAPLVVLGLGAFGTVGLIVLIAVVLNVGATQLYRGFEYASPDRRYVASFFGLGGGGAAGWSRAYVSIRRANSPFDSNSYVIETGHVYEVCLRWLNPTALQVEFPQDADVHAAKEEIPLDATVRVTYVRRPSRRGSLLSQCSGRQGRLGGVDKPWDQPAEP